MLLCFKSAFCWCLFPTALPNIALRISMWYVEPIFCEICLVKWDKLSRQLILMHTLVFIHNYLFNNVPIFMIINVFVTSIIDKHQQMQFFTFKTVLV